MSLIRVDRGYLSHFLFEDFCIFRVWFLGRLWYAKISSELLATIKQYRISFKHNTMDVNEQFIRRRFTCDNLPCLRGKLSHHIISHKKWYPNSIKQ